MSKRPHLVILGCALSLSLLAAPTQAQTVLYETDFTTDAGWTFSQSSVSGPRWAVDALPAAQIVPYTSAPSSLNFNHDVQGLPWGLWSGSATSPEIDLGVATGTPRLQFQYAYHHEWDCQWDAFSVIVLDAVTAQPRYVECLSLTQHAFLVWRTFDLPLDPQWGRVRVRFYHDTIDDWNFNEQGSFVDDLRVVDGCGASLHCAGLPQTSGAPGAGLVAEGSTSIAARDLRLVGEGFPLHTFAAAFAGPDPGVIPFGAGVRCVGVGTSTRLGIAPTRDQGRPVWTLDLGAPPLVQMAVIGQPLYVQTIYRDGGSVNFSAALRILVCP